MSLPFIVHGLPRSRTAWLARFLSYGDYQCAHQQIRYLRTMDDAKAWFSQDFTGTSETAAMPWWRTVQRLRPDIRTLVVRRPVQACVDSMMRVDMRGVGSFDRAGWTKAMIQCDHKLDQIERRVPGVLSVQFDDLADEAVCAKVFEHCLPYAHDHAWWSAMSAQNVQIDNPSLWRYALANRKPLETLARIAKHQTLAAFAAQPFEPPEGITFQVEGYESFGDAEAMFKEHCVAVGEDPDSYLRKNIPLFKRLIDIGALQCMTARSNGRMFGYLITVIAPSLEDEAIKSGHHTAFYASPAFPGLGMKLRRAADAELAKRGCSEVFMRAGVRGSGKRIGSICRRLGSEDIGQMYKLELMRA
jgi:hypothetical protein